MIYDALRMNESFEARQLDKTEEPPNEEGQRFYNLLVESNKLLSQLSMCVRVLGYKSNWNVPDQCLVFFSQNDVEHDTYKLKGICKKKYYVAKRLVSKLGSTTIKKGPRASSILVDHPPATVIALMSEKRMLS